MPNNEGMMQMFEMHDIVHGSIRIPAEINNIIQTNLFQRLKKIKQLGFWFKINSAVSHTRYSHCIGTYHLAKMMLTRLELHSFWITNSVVWNDYRKCIEVAALLHDIGHGPFSHSWEYACENYQHEQCAIPCVDAIFEQLKEQSTIMFRDPDYSIQLTKALITADKSYLPRPLEPKYDFIFDIVNNKRCKIDVDKWDYLKRDYHFISYYCSTSLQFDEVFLEARVSADGDHIEYRYNDYDKIYTLFETRWTFHVKCYRIPLNVLYDKLLKEFVESTDCTINGKRLCDVNAYDLEAFLKLNDDTVIDMIIASDRNQNFFSSFKEVKGLDFYSNCCKDFKRVMVQSIIKGPGEEMPPDEMFHFYGDIRDKRPIQRNMANTERIGFFVR